MDVKNIKYQVQGKKRWWEEEQEISGGQENGQKTGGAVFGFKRKHLSGRSAKLRRKKRWRKKTGETSDHVQNCSGGVLRELTREAGTNVD